MKLTIRLAGVEDIKVMAELDKVCFSSPWSEESFAGEILRNRLALYFVGLVEDQVIGYAGLWRIEDEGHITNVAVHPDYRQRGIGELLVSSLIDHTGKMGIRSHTLEVRVSNDAAIQLYEKLGFQEAGRRKKYYEDNGEDAMIMWRTE